LFQASTPQPLYLRNPLCGFTPYLLLYPQDLKQKSQKDTLGVQRKLRVRMDKEKRLLLWLGIVAWKLASGRHKPVRFPFSLGSYIFLDAIEETYNRDPLLSVKNI
jgi:hypothetical protein